MAAPVPGRGARPPKQTPVARDDAALLFDLARRLAAVVIPGSFVTGLFYYFGVAYTRALYGALGVNYRGLEFTTTDFVIRSLNVTVEPMRTVLIVATLVAVGHVGVRLALSVIAQGPTVARTVAWVVGPATAVVGLVLLYGSWNARHFRLPNGRLILLGHPWQAAAIWLVGSLVMGYAYYLHRETFDSAFGSAGARKRRRVETRSTMAVLTLVFVISTSYGVFETTRHYAQLRGQAQAERNEANCHGFPLVAVYSLNALYLEHDGIETADLGPDTAGANMGDDAEQASGYRFRYDGMRLFIHDNGRFVVWPADRALRGGVIILREDAGIRVELTREPSAPPKATSAYGHTSSPCPVLT
ncbi:MAG: hypothetical protein AAF467_07185 [Actinomycetota bacterium]